MLFNIIMTAACCKKPKLPSVLGQPFGGGYFVGNMVVNNLNYALIVSPKIGGEHSSPIQWKTTNTSSPGTALDSDGYANTIAMNDALHPSAQFCTSQRLGGFDDWYMPSPTELAMCYSALSPNSTSVELFTAHVPQGAERFSTGYYWTSMENTASTVHYQNFSNGAQGSNSLKTGTNLYVRSVRRILIESQ
jgi:hypothetical protein